MNRRIVVGAGMAGLLAAHAIQDVTRERVSLLSDRLPRPLEPRAQGGVHILHDRCSIPDLNCVDVTNYCIIPFTQDTVAFEDMSAWDRKNANALYGDKVYGRRNIDTSIKRMPNVIAGYDYIQAHNWLLERYKEDVQVVRPVNEAKLWRLADEYELVVFTAPRRAVAPKWVSHPYTLAWASHRPPIGWSEKGLTGNFVVYNPDNTMPWSRTARVNDEWYTEFVNMPKYPVPDLHQIKKVQDGDSWVVPENVMLAGRYGEWKAGVLASDVYWQVVQRVREMEDAG